MKLCEHITMIYQNEIAFGNEPVFVSTPSFVDKYASAKMYVFMKKPLQAYKGDTIVEKTWIDCYSPKERYYVCEKCMHCVSGPLEENQKDKYVRDNDKKPCKEVIADKENVYIQDGFYGKFLIPIDKW